MNKSLQKLLMTTVLILAQVTGFAQTCPSVDNIKVHRISGWKVYDSEDGKVLHPRLAKQFDQYAAQFTLAELTSQGRVHCYYRSQNGSNLEAYLAKDHFVKEVPENVQTYWYPASSDLHCAAGKEKCQFHDMMRRHTAAS